MWSVPGKRSTLPFPSVPSPSLPFPKRKSSVLLCKTYCKPHKLAPWNARRERLWSVPGKRSALPFPNVPLPSLPFPRRKSPALLYRTSYCKPHKPAPWNATLERKRGTLERGTENAALCGGRAPVKAARPPYRAPFRVPRSNVPASHSQACALERSEGTLVERSRQMSHAPLPKRSLPFSSFPEAQIFCPVL